MKPWKHILPPLLFLLSSPAFADITITMNLASAKGDGQEIGTVVATDTPYGLLLTPHLKDLPPGVHGFHLHQNPSCDDHAKAAGGHFDPANTNKHLGPYNAAGHLGDLPGLVVDKDGNATLPVLAPRLKEKDLKGHALMIHSGGDNYSDTPKLGGGGDRIACGVVK